MIRDGLVKACEGQPPGGPGGTMRTARAGGLPSPSAVITTVEGGITAVIASVIPAVAAGVGGNAPSVIAPVAGEVVAGGRPERGEAVAADAAPGRDAVPVR